jgi:hypothetical protein
VFLGIGMGNFEVMFFLEVKGMKKSCGKIFV